MNKEEKEIVDDLIKNRDKLVRGFYFPEDLLGTLDLIKVIDYITKLRNENIFLRSHQKLDETFFKWNLEDILKEKERLKEENKILKNALLFIWKDYKVEEINIEELKQALDKLDWTYYC